MNPDTCGASAELTGAINFNLGPKKGEIAQCALFRPPAAIYVSGCGAEVVVGGVAVGS